MASEVKMKPIVRVLLLGEYGVGLLMRQDSNNSEPSQKTIRERLPSNSRSNLQARFSLQRKEFQRLAL